MIRTLHWSAGRGWGDEYRLPDSGRLELSDDDVLWIDLQGATRDEEERVFGQLMPVHSLTREDITERVETPQGRAAHLPKVEEFPDYLFVIVTPLPAPPPAEAGAAPGASALKRIPDRGHLPPPPQLSAVLTHHLLITHHGRELSCVEQAWKHATCHAELAVRGPDYLFHLVLDAMVDDCAPAVDEVIDALDALETHVFHRPRPQLMANLLRLKRRVTVLRKTLLFEREVLARLTRSEFKLIGPRELVYYRDVYDHLVRYVEQIDSAREMVSDLMQSHLSAMSNRLSEVMKVLTMISTVILPMTLITGVYGMNFEWMPGLKSDYGFGATMAFMGLVAAGSLWLFRRKGWI